MVPANGEELYRVIGRSHARPYDFLSNRDKQRSRFTRNLYADHLAVSMFESETLAVVNAVRYPKIVVAVRLDGDHGFSLARTGADIEGHYNVWGDPDDLLESVVGDPIRYDEPGLDSG
jgi:hypothetical protein